MLDHDHRIAEIAQALEGDEQPLVVALVQADRRLVEHIEHARSGRSRSAREANALAFAAGQRAGSARQRQVFEPDIDQEGQPLADLLQDAAGDLVLLGVSLCGQGPNQMRHRAPTGSWCRRYREPAILTASASGFRRLPLQAAQGVSLM